MRFVLGNDPCLVHFKAKKLSNGYFVSNSFKGTDAHLFETVKINSYDMNRTKIVDRDPR